MAEVTLAGKVYSLRYSLRTRKEIEDKSEKGLWQTMFSGEIDDHSIFLWGGLKHQDDKLTPRAVLDLFDAHNAAGGNYDTDVVKPAIRAACVEFRIAGNVNAAEVDRILYPEGQGKA